MDVKCPSCGSKFLYYVQRVYEHHKISKLPDKDGHVDLVALMEVHPDDEDTPYLACDGGCKKTFNLNLEPLLPF